MYSHRQGRLKDDSRALRCYIEQSKGMIELTGLDEIKLSAGYCEHAIAVVRNFFAAMMKEIPDNLLRQAVEEDIAETVEAMKGLRIKKT